MPRYFTHEQATRLLPVVEESLRRAMSSYRDYEAADKELTALGRKIAESGGIQLDLGRAMTTKQARDRAAESLKESVESINEMGVQIKDINTGLIDFPTRYREEEVLLCWRLGERAIEFWHNLTDGFAGRRRIDREFLDNHRGDEAQ